MEGQYFCNDFILNVLVSLALLENPKKFVGLSCHMVHKKPTSVEKKKCVNTPSSCINENAVVVGKFLDV